MYHLTKSTEKWVISYQAASINHMDGFSAIFDPPPPCGPTWFFGQPPRKPCGVLEDPTPSSDSNF